MHGFRRTLFGSVSRRLLTLGATLGIFYGAGTVAHTYIQTECSSPGLSFVLVFLWVAGGAVTGLFTVVAFGDTLLGPGAIDDFLTNEMEALDERLDQENSAEDEDDDFDADVLLRRGSGGTRFGTYFVLFFVGHLFVANSISGDFLQTYSHPGVALIHLRSDDSELRRRGLDMMTERLDFTLTPQVEEIVLLALKDTNEGVVARAAHVAAIVDVEAAVPELVRIINERPALAFAVLIALGQIDGTKARSVARELVQSKEAKKEPVALAYFLGLKRVPEVQTLQAIYAAAGDDEKARVAAVWALGQLRDGRLLKFMVEALKDPDLTVRCAAIEALELMIVTDSAPPLMKAFEQEKNAHLYCPEVNLPVQEGGPIIQVVRYRKVMFSLLRAMATTDHPDLIQWLVEQQERTDDYRTRVFMKKLWESLKAKDARGDLNPIRRKLQQRAAGGTQTDIPVEQGQ